MASFRKKDKLIRKALLFVVLASAGLAFAGCSSDFGGSASSTPKPLTGNQLRQFSDGVRIEKCELSKGGEPRAVIGVSPAALHLGGTLSVSMRGTGAGVSKHKSVVVTPQPHAKKAKSFTVSVDAVYKGAVSCSIGVR